MVVIVGYGGSVKGVVYMHDATHRGGKHRRT
jgi:hypothetical protein